MAVVGAVRFFIVSAETVGCTEDGGAKSLFGGCPGASDGPAFAGCVIG